VGFGLALIQFHPERGGRLGYTALASAAVVLVVGLLRFRVHRRELSACQYEAAAWVGQLAATGGTAKA
jgi:putative membrane protein